MSWLVRVVGVGAACLAPACAQLAGIEQTTGGGSGSGDGGVAGSSLAFDRYSIGATIVQAPQSTAGLALPTFFVDGAQVPGVASASGWAIDQVATSVLFHLPDYPQSIPRLFQFATPAVTSLFPVLERPGATPPAADAQVTVNFTLPAAVAANEQYQLYDLGAWSLLTLAPATAATTITQTTPYASFTSLTGRPLDAIGTGDAVLGLKYAGAQLTAEVDLPGFAQTSADTITGTLVALPGAKHLSAAVPSADATTRLAQARPAGGAPLVAWSLTAAPGAAVASNTGPQLNAAQPPATDTTVVAPYDNPFEARSWPTVFTWVIHADRTYTPAAGALANTPIGLTAELFALIEPGDGTTPDTLALSAGLPTSITLGATALATDGVAITDDPTTPLTVAFTADTTTNTLYQVQIIETALVTGGAQTTTVFGFSGDAPTFTLPANTLVAGHTYRLRAICISGGYPAIGTGDLTQRSLPIAAGVLDSAVFTVGPPL